MRHPITIIIGYKTRSTLLLLWPKQNRSLYWGMSVSTSIENAAPVLPISGTWSSWWLTTEPSTWSHTILQAWGCHVLYSWGFSCPCAHTVKYENIEQFLGVCSPFHQPSAYLHKPVRNMDIKPQHSIYTNINLTVWETTEKFWKRLRRICCSLKHHALALQLTARTLWRWEVW